MRVSPSGIAVASLLSLLALILFYTLAIHMFQSLGAWPTSIGEAGFPPLLVVHSTLASACFWAFVLLTLFIYPVAFLTCAFTPRLRRFIPYLAVYLIAWVIGIVLMQSAPKPFLYWWMD